MNTKNKGNLAKILCILIGVALLAVDMFAFVGCTKNSESTPSPTPTEAVVDNKPNTDVATNTGAAPETGTETGSQTGSETVTTGGEDVDTLYPVNACESIFGTRLCENFADDFYVGTCVSYSLTQNETATKVIVEQFNSVTCENEMKPDHLLDKTASKLNGEITVKFPNDTVSMLNWAKDHNLKMRGHTMVWYSQTPNWIFYEDFDTSKSLVSREVMLERMESIIRQEFEYVQENYPDMFYAWDVCNEVIADEGGLRDCLWKQTIGDDYIEQAFTFARKYCGDIKLFINDYNCYVGNKRTTLLSVVKDLAEKGLIDGVGMQSHLDVGYPSVGLYTATMKMFAAFGVEVQITEMDITTDNKTEKGLNVQGQMYGDIMKQVVDWDRDGTVDCTSVTIWGLYDKISWRSSQVPTLFDNIMLPKPAYNALMEITKG